MAETGGGAIALAGSGEYTAAMDEADRMLLRTLGRSPARVAVVPTASGLEPGQPRRWNAMGAAHYRALGAEVTEVLLVTRGDATSADVAAVLAAQDMVYFSGGSPDYAVETLEGTPAWEAVLARHRAGAALGGCSAGAMMLGGFTLGIRALRSTGRPTWQPALGLLPGLAVMPHFDRMRGFVTDAVFATIMASAPPGVTVVGVDEDTALVGLPGPAGREWRVVGRQGVTLFRPGAAPAAFVPGDHVPLEA